ncbi:MAG: SCO family protein [Deltaproteobacteria bacterium]|nr:SCO family protein [Deltaproteobacteria bacterium]
MSRALVIAALVLLAIACSGSGSAPPSLLRVPDFSLTDQAGQPLRASDLEGKIWIADFFFTSCPTICPVLTTQMQNLARRLGDRGDELHFVSFTVDPRVDTPETLQTYAERFSIDTRHWSLVTGEPAAMRRVVESFRVAVGEPTEQESGGYDIAHDTHFVLVDKTRHLRGYYPHDGEGVDRLARDALHLLNE